MLETTDRRNAQEAARLTRLIQEIALNKSLTIVLPVYNAESRLRSCVGEILELASELTAKFSVLIIDDGSNDATFEVAEELAAHYPQVSLLRHRHRRGLGATLEYVQRRVRSDAVILHDGVTPIDPRQMRSVWHSWIAESTTDKDRPTAASAHPHDICDFANLPAIHAAMEQVHGRVLGFHLITPLAAVEPLPKHASTPAPLAPRSDAAHFPRHASVGQIPPLPRPKFLSAVAEFALGE